MKVSWKFFAGTAAGLALIFALTFVAFLLNLGAPTISSRWASQINQKKRLLAARKTAPKLLLVGGSTTLFGLSAKEIEAQTGYPVVNLGTHAALGTSFILWQAEQIARPGDTVLLTLEYPLYNYGKLDRALADALLLDYVVARDPEFFRALTTLEKWNVFMLTSNQRLVRGIKGRIGGERPTPDLGVYAVENVNEWGDQAHHTRALRSSQRDAITSLRDALGYGLPEHPAGFPVIEKFCLWARDHRVRVIAGFPNLCDRPEYHAPPAEAAADRIREFYSRLGVPMVGVYTDSLLPADEFFDTPSHLTEEAALARTQRLIPQLRPFLN